MSSTSTTATFTFSEVLARQGKAYKRIVADSNGRPVKDPTHKQGVSLGRLTVHSLSSLSELGEFITKRHGKNIALVHGIPKDGNYSPRTLETKDALAHSLGLDGKPISRTKADLGYGDWYLMMLDIDGGTQTAQEVVADFVSVNPEFVGAEWLAIPSSGSFIYSAVDGRLLKGQGGWHIYFVVSGNMARAKDIWLNRYRLAGKSYYILGEPNKATGTPQRLERFPIDFAVLDGPERFDYIAGARTGDGLRQIFPAPQHSTGRWVNLDDIPDLSPQDIESAAKIQEQQRNDIQPERVKVTSEHVMRERPDLSPVEVKREAVKRLRQCDRGELLPDHRLYLANGSTITAGDIGPEHHKVKLRDPQEPDYRGGAINSIIYCETQGKWTIHSQAHGGKNYFPVGKGKQGKGKGKVSQAEEAPKACTVADSLGLAGHDGDGDKAMALLQEHYRKGKHQPDRVIVNGPDGISPEDEQFLLDGQAPKVLTGRTGCGKTEVIARLLKGNRDILPHQLGLAISIVLTGGLAGRTDLNPVSSQHSAPTSEGLDNAVISIESLYRTAGHAYNATATDEFDVALYRLFAAELGQQSQDLNLQQLRRLAEQTEHQFYMQANPSPVGIEAIAHLKGKAPQIIEVIRETGQVSKVNVTICEDGYDDDRQLPLRGSKTLVDKLLTYAKAGKKVVLFAGGVGNLKAVQRILRGHGIAVTLRDGSYTLAPIAVGFGESPTDHAALRNVTFICRNAEIGVDLQNDFDAVFFWASPQQTAEDCYQHLSRARSLFDGRCQELIIKFPSDKAKFVNVEHLDPAFHRENIKAKHTYYLGLLKDAQSSHGDDLRAIEARLAELDTIHGFLARYRAEAAAGQLFQREYLQHRMVELGWSIKSLDPSTACNGKRDFNEVLQGLRRKADEAKAFVIAKGRPTISCYSEARAKQLEDSNQNGFVIDGYRQKINLVSQIPGAPTHDPAWILEHILDNERQLPQARLLGLYLLGQDETLSHELQRYSQLQQGFNIRFGMEHGPTALMRSMESSHSLSLLSVWVAVLAGGPRFVLDLLQGDRATIHRLEPDVAEFAARVRQHGDRLNGMARYCLGKADGFDWDEPDDMAIVNKFLSAFMGLDLVKVGQVRVGKERPPTYALAGKEIGAFRKANATTMALARTKGQIGNTEARQAAQTTILNAAIATGNQGAADSARVELTAIAERLKTLKAKLIEQQNRMEIDSAAAVEVWPEIERQFKEHLNMGACAAMGWVGRVNLTREEGVNLNQQTMTMLSQFRLTPPEPPPPNAPNNPEPPAAEASPRLVDAKTGRLFCDLVESDGDFYLVRWPDGRETFVPCEDYAPAIEVAA